MREQGEEREILRAQRKFEIGILSRQLQISITISLGGGKCYGPHSRPSFQPADAAGSTRKWTDLPGNVHPQSILHYQSVIVCRNFHFRLLMAVCKSW